MSIYRSQGTSWPLWSVDESDQMPFCSSLRQIWTIHLFLLRHVNVLMIPALKLRMATFVQQTPFELILNTATFNQQHNYVCKMGLSKYQNASTRIVPKFAQKCIWPLSSMDPVTRQQSIHMQLHVAKQAMHKFLELWQLHMHVQMFAFDKTFAWHNQG